MLYVPADVMVMIFPVIVAPVPFRVPELPFNVIMVVSAVAETTPAMKVVQVRTRTNTNSIPFAFLISMFTPHDSPDMYSKKSGTH
jgi:hypothetical protein